jgi:putative serine protease PepD
MAAVSPGESGTDTGHPPRTSVVAGLAIAVALGCSACTGQGGQPGPSGPSSSGSAASSAPAAPGSAIDWTRVAAQTESSVVSISVVGRQGAGEGSGVVIDTEGHVLTNNHVVAAGVDGATVQVSLADASVLPAQVVGNDPATDLAVLKLTNLPPDTRPLPFGDSEKVEVGQFVMALGNPLSLAHTVTLGIVSALDRPVTTQAEGTSSASEPVVTNAIQTDAAVNPGNSGGALIDGAGRLIGINSSIASLGASAGGQGGSIGLGFAIPSNQAKWVSQKLIQSGKVEHAFLGVSSQNAIVKVGGTAKETAQLTTVAPDTPAAKAGLQPGDSVLKVDDEIVAGSLALVAQVRERPPGTRVELTVADRDGATRTVPVQFGTRPP